MASSRSNGIGAARLAGADPAFLEGAETLFIDVARKAYGACRSLGRGHRHRGHGLFDRRRHAQPGSARRRTLGFRARRSRVPVFGLGCAGGVSGLSIASRLAQAQPGTNVLLVAVELCTLAVRLDELTKANIVATRLFADGAAAVILRAGDGGPTRSRLQANICGRTRSTSWDGTRPEGFGVIFERTIPAFVAEHIGPALPRS